MDDVVVRPGLPARLTSLVALKVGGHASGLGCEAGLAGCVENAALNCHGVGKLPLFGERHGQRLPEVKSLQVRDQTLDDRLCAPAVADLIVRCPGSRKAPTPPVPRSPRPRGDPL